MIRRDDAFRWMRYFKACIARRHTTSHVLSECMPHSNEEKQIVVILRGDSRRWVYCRRRGQWGTGNQWLYYGWHGPWDADREWLYHCWCGRWGAGCRWLHQLLRSRWGAGRQRPCRSRRGQWCSSPRWQCHRERVQQCDCYQQAVCALHLGTTHRPLLWKRRDSDGEYSGITSAIEVMQCLYLSRLDLNKYDKGCQQAGT